MAFAMRVKVAPNSANLQEARARTFDFFRAACRSIPAIMDIYNLYDVVNPSQLRSTIAAEIRKNAHITNPKHMLVVGYHHKLSFLRKQASILMRAKSLGLILPKGFSIPNLCSNKNCLISYTPFFKYDSSSSSRTCPFITTFHLFNIKLFPKVQVTFFKLKYLTLVFTPSNFKPHITSLS